MTDSERLTKVIKFCGERNNFKQNINAFALFLDLRTPQVLYDISRGRNGISRDIAEIITAKCLDINIGWLLTGDGNMLKNDTNFLKVGTPESLIHYIRLLPMSAVGGTLNEFTVAVKDFDCEKIISPIKEADFAITVTGSSMYPELPAGSQILIKKIDENQFIEWGRLYVLDTVNGTVVKRLIKGDPGFYHCVSSNSDQDKYAPFDVPVSAVFGIYKVMMIMSMK